MSSAATDLNPRIGYPMSSLPRPVLIYADG